MRIALTGGIASGKSAVAEVWETLGAVIVDADVLARLAVAPHTPGLAQVRDRFGESVLTADGEVDRSRLAKIVFADADARADLEAIIHPEVRRLAAELVAKVPADTPVVEVIPLLAETRSAHTYDHVVVVDVPVDTQRARLIDRNGLSTAEADARISAQATRQQRLAIADVVIDNSGSRHDLVERATRVWNDLVT